MTPQAYAILTALIEERVGLHYNRADQALFEGKVLGRALELGFDSGLDYYYFLRYDDPDGLELAALTELLVVNETYFFREYDKLQAVLARFVLPLVAEGQRPRIWCAACSTGEEAYTIAMWLEERGLLDAVELIASDISPTVLAVAQGGRYRRRSIRQVPEGVDITRHLASEGETWIVRDSLRSTIQWRRINLLDEAAVQALGQLDLVFCRNVLIYFSDELVRRLADRIAHQLKPGGVLLVGVSESLMRFGIHLTCEEHDGAFVYRKARTQ